MANINEEARIPVYLNDEQAVAAMKNLQNEADKWRKKMHEAMAGGDMKGMKTAERELKKVNKEASKLRKASFDTNKVLNNLSSASYKDLRQTLRTLTREQEQFNRKSKEWKTHKKNIRLVRAEMKKVNGELQAHGSWWGKAANGFNKYWGIATAGLAAFTGIAFSVKEWTSGLVGLDDQLANVMKTTALTRKEARELYTDFKYLNTRTPRKELLLLAEEAGRLGKRGKKDIMDFVEVANMISVALGDDLGGNSEEATREVGKLTDNLNVGEQYGVDFGKAMEKAGSGINEVAANSKAQAGYIIEFTKRTQGLGEQANITAADLFGLAATFDESGQAVEMSATAVNKIIVDMFRDTSDYAEVANMSVADFTELLNTDTNEAFIAMLKGLEGNNQGLGVMVEKFDAMGIDGSRATQAMASLVGNLDRLRINQQTANKAMDEGTSLANEYNIKNNNLAGSMDKIGRAIRSKFINSGFLGWMEKVVAKASEWVEVPIQEKIKNETLEVNQLVIEMTNANTTAERRNEIYTQLNQIAPDVVKNIDLENISVSNLRENLEKYNEAMIKKLALQDTEDNLQDKREAAGKATGTRIEKESQLITEFISIKQQADKMNKDYADNLQEVILSDDDVITKTERINELLEGQRHFYRTNMEVVTNEVVSAREKEKAALDEVNQALDEYSQRYERLFGAGKSGSGTGGNAGGGSGTGGSGFSNPGTGAQGGFAYEQATEDPLAVEGWMTDDKWNTYGAEELAARQASEEEWTQFLTSEIQQRIDAEAKALQIEQEIAEARREINNTLIESTGQVASSLAGMFEQGSTWQIAFIAMEKAAGIAKIWINYAKEASAINLAAAEINAVTFGVGGTVWGAAQLAKAKTSAIANTAIIGAQTVASIASSGKRKKTQAYAEGKYPGVQTGTYGDRPHYALFNEVPGYPEMVVDGRTFKTMQMNYPELINAIYRIRDGKQPGGYADGKYADGGANPTQPYTPILDIDKFDKAVTRLENMKLSFSYDKFEKLEKEYKRQQQGSGM